MFLPPLGGASPTLILDRAIGRFTVAELARVERVFPLLAGLHNAHLKAIISRGVIAHDAEKPFRLIDRSGKELAVNLAWKKYASEPGSGLTEALADFGDSRPNPNVLARRQAASQISLGGRFRRGPRRTLRSSRGASAYPVPARLLTAGLRR